MWTAVNTQQTIQIFLVIFQIEGGSWMVCGKGCAPPIPLPKIHPCCLLSGYEGFLTFFYRVNGDGRPSTYPEAWTTLDFRAGLCRERSGLIHWTPCQVILLCYSERHFTFTMFLSTRYCDSEIAASRAGSLVN